MLLVMNKRNPEIFDPWYVDIVTGKMTQAQVDQLKTNVTKFTGLFQVLGGVVGPLFGGAAILQQKANAMYTSERRRLFLVSLEDGGTTMNAHDAFLRNLNLIVNTNDIPQLPLILNRAVLDFNDLYHYLNKGLGVEPI